MTQVQKFQNAIDYCKSVAGKVDYKDIIGRENKNPEENWIIQIQDALDRKLQLAMLTPYDNKARYNRNFKLVVSNLFIRIDSIRKHVRDENYISFLNQLEQVLK